ncbi:MAG: tetratricopeptide repeat protein [Treponema sp.]|jgi:tetratricopeptide (TPR) repeat protein|nr:tetratricopeptide repeat protein [Treponema sp.]
MNTKNRLVFLQVPESLGGRLVSAEHDHESGHDHGEAFTIDPGIPIPVELPGETEAAGKNPLEDLSWEMILAGMLRVLAAPADYGEAQSPGRIGYYRRFILAVKPEIPQEFTGAAVLKAKNGDYTGALEILDMLRGLTPHAPRVLLNRALALEARAASLEREAGAEYAGINAEATGAYEELLALEPPFPDGFFNAGFFYMKGRDYELARDCFSRYLSLVRLPAGAASSAATIEKQARAEALLKEIERNNLDDGMFRDAYDKVREGREEEGLEQIRDFLERHPSVWNGWFLLGWALRRLERWEDGANAFRQALKLAGDTSTDPAGASNVCDIRNELAICLMETGDLAGARKELETALGEEPENIKIISNLGVLALRRDRRDEAAGFFRTVLEIEPEDPLARQYLASLGGA